MIRGLLVVPAILVLGGQGLVAGPAWRLVQSESREVAPSVRFVQKTVSPPGGGTGRQLLTLVFFQADEATFKVVDQGGDKRKPAFSGLGEAMQKTGALAGTNGGFFQENFAPLGMQIADGKRTGSFNKGSSLLSGVVYVDAAGKPRLVRRGKFKDDPGIRQLLQSGPFLVDGGKAVAGLSTDRSANRTFVLKGSGGTWAVGRSSRLSLAEIGAILASPGVITETKIERALNLDGGSSTAIWVKAAGTNGADHYKRSWATVRNFIAIVKK